MNVQEVMYLTGIVGNAAVVMSIFFFFSQVIALAKVAPHAVIVGQDYPVSDAAEEVEISLMVAIDKISVVA